MAETVGLSGWLLGCAHCRNATHPPPGRQEHTHPARRWTMIIPTVHLTSDQQIIWQHGFIKLNGTIVTTWAMMIAMTLGSRLITRKLAPSEPFRAGKARLR